MQISDKVLLFPLLLEFEKNDSFAVMGKDESEKQARQKKSYLQRIDEEKTNIFASTVSV